jgi:Ca-activated chloride channel family protein
MSLLNPLAIAMFIPIFFIFKTLIFSKYKQSNIYNKQSKLILLVISLCILALSRPVFVDELKNQKFDAGEYIIALDASFSMSADDIKPSRYEVAKEVIIKLLTLDAKDRFSLFAFTSNPLLICPPTTDSAIAINALNALSQKYILTKGTSVFNLLKYISRLKKEKKNLILFSDGGDEHQLNKLLEVAKNSAIVINIVAVGSKKGTTLSRNNQTLKNQNQDLIISRINPILKDLAKGTGGFYFEIDGISQDISSDIFKALKQKQSKKIQTQLISYQELYIYPLLLAFFILLISLSKYLKYIPFLSLIFLLSPTTKLKADIFDFYYLDKANQAYSKKEYKNSAKYFLKISPSQSSYLNIANCYYHQKNYKKAMEFYSKIESKNIKLKQTLFYNMGNCAVKLQRYDRAKDYYKKALACGFDKDSFENLTLLYKLQIKDKIDVADMMPHPNSSKKKNSSKKTQKQKAKENKNEQSHSQKQKKSSTSREANNVSQGSADSKNTKKQNKKVKNINSRHNYQMGYKAYEIINKGYTNEKNSW